MDHLSRISVIYITILTVAVYMLSIAGCAGKTPVDYVNPFIGTKSHSERLSTGGRTHPGACVPFGMTKWIPANINGVSVPYVYVDSTCFIRGYEDTINLEIFGFRGSHYPNGSWMKDYASYDFMPIVGELKFLPNERSSRISHDKEHASPGYYSVYLSDLKTQAEVTATRRCGYLKFTFPDTDKVHLLVDTRMGDGYVEILPERNRIIGYNSFSRNGRITGYFVADFNKKFSSFGIWDKDIFEGSTKANGENVKAYVTFDTKSTEVIELKVGTSFIGFDIARSNLDLEIGAKTFATVRREAREVWNEKLSKIEVEGGNEEDKIKFYTSLYWVFFEPRISSSGNKYYSAFDEKVHETSGYDFYDDFSLWDTYRNKHPLLTLLEPKIEGEMIQSLIDMYKQGGWIPKWPNPGYSNCMIGTHATPVITDAYLKGIDNFDVEKAYEGMKKNAMIPAQGKVTKYGKEFEGRVGISYYKDLGFVPADKVGHSTSRTMEFAFDDWALAQMAKALGKDEDYKYFMKRAGYYINVIDTTVGYARGRNSDGSWVEPFDPTSFEDYKNKGPGFRVHYEYITEGSPLQYTWHVQHDPQGLIKLLGGREKFVAKLNETFSNAEAFNFAEWNPFYNQSNEPCMHMVYLFNYAGYPWMTQKWVRAIMAKSYGAGPDGMVGNDDVGTMSAWYVFSAMGFYPIAPGLPIYPLGSPIFDKITIHLPQYLYGGKDFVIITKNNSAKNKYIQSASLNGMPLENAWIKHSFIRSGYTLILHMGNEPNKAWGNTKENGTPFMTGISK